MNKLNLAEFKHYLFWAFTLVLFGIANGCVSEQIKIVQDEQNSLLKQNNFPTIQQINSSGKSETFINENGWEIPNLSSSKISSFNPKLKVKDIGNVTVNMKEYEPSINIITDEPFASINQSLGQIKYRTIHEYSINNHIFCYKIQANRVTVDEKTGSITQSSGSLFFFSYYDENGDGIFETLVLDEVGPSGFSIFSDPPHIPKWVLQKRLE